MRRFSFPLLAGALMFVLAPWVHSAALETVSLGGVAATHVGPGALTAAVASVDDGGEVQILEAGTYNPVVLPGIKDYEIIGTVDGVVVQGVGQPAMTANATTDTIDVVITNVDLVNTAGNPDSSLRAAFYGVQGTSATTLNLEFNDLSMLHSDTVTSGGGEALLIAGNNGDDSAVNVSMDNCTFQSMWLPVSGNDNIHAATIATRGLAAKDIRITSCTFESASGQAFRPEPGGNAVYTVRGSLFKTTNLGRSTFRDGGSDFANTVFDLEDTTILSNGGEAFISHNTSAGNNVYRFNRCTIDGRRDGGGDGKQTVYIRCDATNGTDRVEMYNCVILAALGDIGLNTRDDIIPTKVYHCTFIQEGTDTGDGFRAQDGDASLNEVYNNIFVRFGNPLRDGGTWTNVGGNLTAPGDGNADPDLGGDQIVTTDTLLNLNANYVPQAGSPAIDAAITSGTIQGAIAYVDRTDAFRGAGHLYDIGAFETNAQTVSPITVSQAGVVADIMHVDGIEMASANIPDAGLIQVIEAGTYGQFDVYGGKQYTVEATVNGVISEGEVDVVDDAGPADITLRGLTIAGKIDNNSDTNVDQQNWLIDGCTIVNDNTKGFEVDQACTSSTFVFRNTVIDVEEQCIIHDRDDASIDPFVKNSWVFERCTFNNSRYNVAADRVIRIVYRDNDPNKSTVDVFNCLFLSQEGPSDNDARALYFANGEMKVRVYYSTFVAAGAGGQRAIFSSFEQPGSEVDVHNCLILNYTDPTSMDTGSTGGNMIVGPADEGGLGGDRIYINQAAGLAGVLAAAGITEVVDPLNPLRLEYIPQTTSPTSQAVDAATSVGLASVGYVDRRGHVRFGPQAPADIGAFETDKGGVPVELSSFMIE